VGVAAHLIEQDRIRLLPNRFLMLNITNPEQPITDPPRNDCHHRTVRVRVRGRTISKRGVCDGDQDRSYTFDIVHIAIIRGITRSISRTHMTFFQQQAPEVLTFRDRSRRFQRLVPGTIAEKDDSQRSSVAERRFAAWWQWESIVQSSSKSP